MSSILNTVIIISLFWGLMIGAPNPCSIEDSQEDCNETQYEEYRKCVEEHKRTREKRQLLIQKHPCEDLLNKTSDFLELKDQEEVKVLPPSTHIIEPLERLVTVEPIEVDLNADLDWAIKKHHKKLIIEGDGNGDGHYYEYDIPANITTIIKLTNIINNTNIVNVPTNINTTNINNIHVYANISDNAAENPDDDGEFGLGRDKNGSCCIAVRPKSCHASTNGYKCNHRRFKTCGKQCTSRIIHVQLRKSCTEKECKQNVTYVPQPHKTKCHHINQWPYTVCGGERVARNARCDGCYDHYGYEVVNYYGESPPRCFGCFDDGFQYGPLYRRGPILRPFYYHEPPCHLSGVCEYDHEMGGQHFEPELDQTNYLDIDYELDESVDGKEEDWGVPIHKCSVISADNTISIQNCTTKEDNPYAAAPAQYPYYPPINYLRQNNKNHQRRHLEEDNFRRDHEENNAKFVVEDDYDESSL